MTNLVYLEPKGEPFTTSKVLAEAIGYEHHSITRVLRRHEADFEAFGLLGRTVHAVRREGARGTRQNGTAGSLPLLHFKQADVLLSLGTVFFC